MTFFHRYLELILTVLGLAICSLAIYVLPEVQETKWRTVTLIALVISSIHGVIFFLVRRRERLLRTQVIKEATSMLQDRINNLMFSVINGANTGDKRLEEHARKSQEEIQSILDTLSLDSIQKWKDYYSIK